MNKPEYIIMHHSLTKDQKVVDWQAIRRYHKGLGWRDVGYHYGIELVNNEPEILLGRYPYESGAHCRQNGMNRRSIGVMICGNFDLDPPESKVWIKALELVRYLQYEHGIKSHNVVGHSTWADYKSCPGKKFDMEKFRNEL
jgi:N-acetyl-anhydromuramyl-L-alanine amidase AmpD